MLKHGIIKEKEFGDYMNNYFEEAKALYPELVSNRRHLHTIPEVGFALTNTKAYVKAELQKLGYKPVECGKAGLIALVGGKKPGKTFLLRADMDALPMREESGEDFSSRNGAMHACGHDFHTAMLLGAAKLLKEHENEINGTVKLMFQPAEEIFSGALDMLENGVLECPRPDAGLMIHVAAGVPMEAGTIIISAPGVSAPAADYFTIKVKGTGCHGSTPQKGVDAITVSAHILMALQEIHARELIPGEKAVLTIGTIHGGTAPNAIADTAEMSGTIRTFNEETRSFLKERMEAISASIATAYRAEARVEFGGGCPTLKNDKGLVESSKAILGQSLEEGKVFSAEALGHSSGGSEDFAYISQEIPTLMLALCAGSTEKGYTIPLHHPKVRFDEAALPYGTAALTAMAMEWLKQH